MSVTIKIGGRTLKAVRAAVVFPGGGQLEVASAEEVGGGLLVRQKQSQKGQPRRAFVLPWGAVWQMQIDNLD